MDQKEKGIHLVLLLTNNGTFYIQRIKKRKKSVCGDLAG